MPKEKLIYENEEKEDIKFPELLNYENLVYSPEQLKDINAAEGQKLNIAINDAGQVITDLINSKLNTQTKQILDGFTFGASGAIKIITDANNGIWISPTGILGKHAGATTFAIDILGNPTFAGTLSAASGTLGTITSATITAGTFQTAASGKRIAISNSDNSIKIYDLNGSLQATISGESAYGLYINGYVHITGDIFASHINAGGSGVNIEGDDVLLTGDITCAGANFSATIHAGGAVISDTSVLAPAFSAYGGGKATFHGSVTACPLPISVSSALEKIGNPKPTAYEKLKDKRFVERDKDRKNMGIERMYYDVKQVPKECRFINSEGKDDIEISRTVGFLYQCVIELNNKIENLKSKI